MINMPFLRTFYSTLHTLIACVYYWDCICGKVNIYSDSSFSELYFDTL